MKLKGYRYPEAIILQSVRWYLRYGLSYRDLGEMLEERGVLVDHTSPFRWVIRLTPQLVTELGKRKAPVGGRWRLDGDVRACEGTTPLHVSRGRQSRPHDRFSAHGAP